MTAVNSFKSKKSLKVGSKTYTYYSLKAAEKNGLAGISRLPYSMKVLLVLIARENSVRSVAVQPSASDSLMGEKTLACSRLASTTSRKRS